MVELPELNRIDDLERYLPKITLEDLLDECRKRGITQKRLAQMFRLPANFLTVVKSSERQGHYFNFIGACKIACLYVLDMEKRTREEKR